MAKRKKLGEVRYNKKRKHWYIDIPAGVGSNLERTRRWVDGKSEDEAQLAANRLIVRIEDGEVVPAKSRRIDADPWTWKRLVDFYYDTKISKLRPKTQTTVLGNFKRFARVFDENTLLRKIKKESLQAAVAKLINPKRGERRLSHGSIKITLSTVRSVLRWNDEEEVRVELPANLAKWVKIARQPNDKGDEIARGSRPIEAEDIFELGEISRILAVAREKECPQVALALEVLFKTGCRIGEMIGMLWQDLTLNATTGRTEWNICRSGKLDGTKSHRSRVFTLQTELAARLWTYNLSTKPKYKQPHNAIFHNPTGGVRSSWPMIAAALRRCAVLAGCPRKRYFPHMCRHTWATVMLRAGEKPMAIAELLGHRGTELLELRYGHLSKQDHLAVSDAVFIAD
jgi:integrase